MVANPRFNFCPFLYFFLVGIVANVASVTLSIPQCQKCLFSSIPLQYYAPADTATKPAQQAVIYRHSDQAQSPQYKIHCLPHIPTINVMCFEGTVTKYTIFVTHRVLGNTSCPDLLCWDGIRGGRFASEMPWIA